MMHFKLADLSVGLVKKVGNAQKSEVVVVSKFVKCFLPFLCSLLAANLVFSSFPFIPPP